MHTSRKCAHHEYCDDDDDDHNYYSTHLCECYAHVNLSNRQLSCRCASSLDWWQKMRLASVVATQMWPPLNHSSQNMLAAMQSQAHPRYWRRVCFANVTQHRVWYNCGCKYCEHTHLCVAYANFLLTVQCKYDVGTCVCVCLLCDCMESHSTVSLSTATHNTDNQNNDCGLFVCLHAERRESSVSRLPIKQEITCYHNMMGLNIHTMYYYIWSHCTTCMRWHALMMTNNLRRWVVVVVASDCIALRINSENTCCWFRAHTVLCGNMMY